MTDGINVVSLRTAILCVDCEVISTGSGARCHVCGSSAVLSLSRILGGPLEETTVEDCDEAAEFNKLLDGLFLSVETTLS